MTTKKTILTLNDVANKYDRIKHATPQDGKDLVEIFKDVPMRTPLFDIFYDRSPDYFHLLNLQKGKPFVFILKSSSGKTQGVATFIIKEQYIGTQLTKVLYVGDMRTTPDIEDETRNQWKKAYEEFMEKMEIIEEFKGIRYCYGALLTGNKRAVKAFTTRKNKFIFKQLGSYQTLNIYGRKPKIFQKKKHNKIQDLKVQSLDPKDLKKFKIFLEEQNKNKIFGDYFSKDSTDTLDYRLKNWPNFTFSNFIIIKNAKNEILGSCCPWSPSQSKKFILSNLSFKLKIIGLCMPFLGKPPIKNKSTLETLYLTHFEIKHGLPFSFKERILELMMNEIEKKKLRDPYHLLTLLDWPDQSYKKMLKQKGYLLETSKGKMFQLIHENYENNSHYELPFMSPYFGFELALV
jgi:hypothetical protein